MRDDIAAAYLQWRASEPVQPLVEVSEKLGIDFDHGREESIERMVEAEIGKGKQSTHSASLVLLHAVIDALLLDYIKVLTLIAEDDFAQYLPEKQIPLKDALDQERETIVRGVVDRWYSKEADRLPLPEKFELLFRQCRHADDYSPVPGFKLDGSLLRRIDKARNDIIHHKGLGTPLPSIQDDLEYLVSAVEYCTRMIHDSYNLDFDFGVSARMRLGIDPDSVSSAAP
jgi:hypothetical protein